MRTLALTLVTLLSTTPALADTWTLDPDHSRVGFAVSHLMVSTVEGEFRDVAATLEHDLTTPQALSVRVSVDLASVDTRNDKRDEHLRSSDFLDIATHPTMTFESTRVRWRRNGAFTVDGTLTLRGVSKPLTLTGKGLTQVVTDPWGNERVGVSATGILNRQDFGVQWNQALETGGVLVGDEVTLRIDAEFLRTAK